MAAKRFPRAGVATPHYLASAAGLAALARGGNAVDAAVAANLALGVVAPYTCGYGGDLFAIVWDGSLHGYLGSGRAPASATIESVRSRAGTDDMPVLGPHAVTVPGVVAGWFGLLGKWGTRSFGELAGDARSYAQAGFEVSPGAGRALRDYATIYDAYPEFRAMYGQTGAWNVLRQPALARTIELLADDGPDAYYRGPIGAAIAETVQRHGGQMTADDVARHEGQWCDPLRARYRDSDVAELPPPTQGVSALEALRIVDGFELAPDGPERHHLLVEAAKLALADRDEHVSDPDAMKVAPEALLDGDWIASRRRAIDPTRASAPEPGAARVGGTAYLCAADGDGLLVSLIQSNFLAFGSGLHVPEWGINLNNRGSSFSFDPSRVNALAPSKLPMHTLIPAMALRDGAPWLVFGSMGGDSQAQIHLQLLTRMIDDAADPQDALDAPRWCVVPPTWGLRIERRFAAETIDGLRARGHEVEIAPRIDTGMGHAHAIQRTPGGYAVATDPRAEGAALGL